jgi:hypothetical protein
MPVLLNEQDSAVGKNWEDHDGAWMGDDFARRSDAARLDDPIAADPKDWALINCDAAEDSGLL